jgi:hypothetical protein
MTTASRSMVAAILALPMIASASETVTETPRGWRAYPALPTDVFLPTKEECLAALKARGSGAYSCQYSINIIIAQTCADEPMPVWPTIVDGDGFIVRPGIKGEVRDDGAGKVIVVTTEEGFVKGPGYPKCWVPGLVPYDGSFRAPDGPPDMTPSPLVYGVDPEWPIGTKCPLADPKFCYAAPPPAPQPPVGP